MQLAGDRFGATMTASVDPMSFTAFAWSNVAYIVQTTIAAPILLGIYRFALAGDARATYDVLSPRGRKFLAANVVFVLCGVAVIGLMLVPYSYRDTAPGLWVPAGLAAILVSAASFYASTRVLLLFPLIAVDRPRALAASLALTRGHTWRIFCLSMLPAIIAALAAAATLAPVPRILIDVLMAGIRTIGQIVFIAAIALAYRYVAAGEDRPVLDVSLVPPPGACPARS